MIRFYGFMLAILVLTDMKSFAQQKEDDTKGWNYVAEPNFFLQEKEFIFIPVFIAQKGKLHLEGRYNYEDLHTTSLWVGYKSEGKRNDLEYTLIPMIAGVFGNSSGVAPGLDFELSYHRFYLYTFSEFLFNTADKNGSYFYNWAEGSFQLSDIWRVGLVGQRTRLYKTALDYQRGFLVGAEYKQCELSAYMFNPGFDTPFYWITLAINF